MRAWGWKGREILGNRACQLLGFSTHFSTQTQILSIVLFAILKSKFSTGAEFNTASLEAESWGKLCFLYLSDTINR